MTVEALQLHCLLGQLDRDVLGKATGDMQRQFPIGISEVPNVDHIHAVGNLVEREHPTVVGQRADALVTDRQLGVCDPSTGCAVDDASGDEPRL